MTAWQPRNFLVGLTDRFVDASLQEQERREQLYTITQRCSRQSRGVGSLPANTALDYRSRSAGNRIETCSIPQRTTKRYALDEGPGDNQQ